MNYLFYENGCGKNIDCYIIFTFFCFHNFVAGKIFEETYVKRFIYYTMTHIKFQKNFDV